MVGRYGGDEFVIVLAIDIPDDAVVVAERIIAAAGEPFTLDAAELQVSASLGIALYPQDGVTYEELYRKADKALYCAKRAGGGTYAFYRDEPAAS